MGIVALYHIYHYTIEQRLGELTLGGEDRWLIGLDGGWLRHTRVSRLGESVDNGQDSLRVTVFHCLGAGADRLDESKTRVER